jgi:hypothetical protein
VSGVSLVGDERSSLRRSALAPLAWLLAITLWACSAPSKSGGPHLVPMAELPPEKRAVLEQYENDGAAWELRREEVKRDPKLCRFLIDNLVVALVHTYERVGPAQAGQKKTAFDRAQAELVLLQPVSTPVLAQMLALKDGIVSFLAADTLKLIGAPALEHVVPLLDDPTPEVRRRAAKLLGELANGGEREPAWLESLGRRVAHDDAWIVRAEAAEALGARAARSSERGYAVGVLARALGDPDPAVAQSAARGLETAGDARAIPILIRALEESIRQGQPKSAHAIQDALKKLTGETRDRELDEWRAWLEQHPPTARRK